MDNFIDYDESDDKHNEEMLIGLCKKYKTLLSERDKEISGLKKRIIEQGFKNTISNAEFNLQEQIASLQSELEAVKEENKTYLDCIERGNKQVQELKSQTEKLEKERDLLIKKGDFVIDNLIALRKDPKELDRVLREIEEYFNPTTN